MRVFRSFLKRCILWFYYLTRDRKHRSVYFCSFAGQYSDSPKAISEAIHELDPSIELIWRLSPDAETPEYVKRIHSKHEAKIAQTRADAWVMNTMSYSSNGDWKSPTTFSVATWHGDRGFKKIAWAAKGSKSEKSWAHIKSSDSPYIDLYTAASDYGIMQAKEGFHYYGNIQLEGLPRNDKLVKYESNKEYSLSIKKQLGIPDGIKVLMFAPTYRDSIKGKQSSQVDINECLQCLKENGENWICLVRAHSSSKGLSVDLNESIIDVSHKYDMTDLLLISDCLITDYSSCAGDFILTNRPCILAQFDRDEYENHSRELWIDPDETGFLIAKTQEELNHILENLYSYNHTEIAQKVNQFYGTHETGNSSVITAKKIINWINKNHS